MLANRGSLGVAAVLCCMLGAPPAPAQQGPPPSPPVTVAKPLAKRITQWDEYSGQFAAFQFVDVRPRVSGFIEEIHFKDGAIIAAGDLLLTIDKRPFALLVESAQAEVQRNQAQVALAENEVLRAEPLVKTRVITERDFDQRKANLAVARAQLLAAQASLKTAALNLEWTDVRAPIKGRLSDRKVDAGNLVSGGQGEATLLATIVTLDPIHFEFDVSEADVLRYSRLLLKGERPSSRDVANPVRVRLLDEQDWPHTGKMDFVDNAMNARSGTIRARAVLENKDRFLTPGAFGRIQLFGGEIDAILIPDAAVVSDQAKKIVFTVNAESVVTPVPIQLGQMYEGLRVVTSGLDKEARIVVDGIANPMVRPGAKVTVKEGQITAAAN